MESTLQAPDRKASPRGVFHGVKHHQDFALLFGKSLVFFIKIKHNWSGKGIKCASFFLRWSTCTACSVDKSTYSTHLQKFILFGIGHVFIDFRERFGTYTLLNTFQHLIRIGDGRLTDISASNIEVNSCYHPLKIWLLS